MTARTCTTSVRVRSDDLGHGLIRLHAASTEIGRLARTAADWCGVEVCGKSLGLKHLVTIRVSRRPVSLNYPSGFKSLFPLHPTPGFVRGFFLSHLPCAPHVPYGAGSAVIAAGSLTGALLGGRSSSRTASRFTSGERCA